MQIHKSDDTLILLGHHAQGGRASLIVTLGFVIEPDGSLLSEQAAWQWLQPQFTAEPFDAALKKRHGTFAVAGSAYAAGGQPVNAMAVRARVGELEKTLHVQGDRQWTRAAIGWQASPAQPFVRMPLELSRAFGGTGCAENPHGRGWLASTDQAEGVPLPNVELPEAPILSPADRPAPATFGVLPQSAPSRTRWLGTYDEAWLQHRFPWLPDDVDARWFDAVPQDQCRAAYWRGDETWSVSGMHPSQPTVSGQLPGLRPRLLLRRRPPGNQTAGAPWPMPEVAAAEASLDLDTVWLFPDPGRVILLYRAEIPVQHEDATDIAALGVFMEHLNDEPHPTAHWDAVWQPASQPAPVSPPAPEAAATKAEPATASAAATLDTAALTAQVQAKLNTRHQETLATIASQFAAAGLPFDPSQYPAPQVAPPVAKPLGQPNADLSAQISQRVNSRLAAAREQAENAVRQAAQAIGHDPEEWLARARNPQPEPAPDLRSILGNIPHLTSAQHNEALERLAAFEQSMAEVRANSDKLRAQLQDNQQAAGQALAQAGVQGSERLILDRDAVLARHARGEPLRWLDLRELDLSDTDFSGADFSHSILTDCRLDRAQLPNTRWHEATLQTCSLAQADLNQADLGGSQLTDCSLAAATLQAAQLERARFERCDLNRARLDDAKLERAGLSTCQLQDAVLARAHASQAQFEACDLSRADASGANLAGAMLHACVLEQSRLPQANLSNTTLSGVTGTRTNFSHAKMPGLRLDSACVLTAANLQQADLTGASLQDSTLLDARLDEARLDEALIRNCDLTRSQAWRASARRTDFNGSRLVDAYWVAANLMQAQLHEAVLENLDLSGANLHAAQTRTAQVRSVRLDGALLSRCRILEEHAHG